MRLMDDVQFTPSKSNTKNCCKMPSKKDEGKVRMYQSVVSLLQKHDDMLKTLPNYPALFLLLTQYLSEVLAMMEELDSNTEVEAITKGELRDLILLRSRTLLGKLVAFAKHMKNQEMLTNLHSIESELSSCSDYTLTTHAKKVSGMVSDNLTDLVAYRATKEDSDELITLSTRFLNQIPEPTEAKKDQGEMLQAFEAMLKKIDDLLLEIDAELRIVQFSEVEFYTHYKKSRKVVLLGVHPMSMICKVTNFKTGKGEKGVKVTVVMMSDDLKSAIADVIKKKTAAKGGFRLKSLPDGKYVITFSKQGFVTQTVTVYVNSGETTTVKVVLQPL